MLEWDGHQVLTPPSGDLRVPPDTVRLWVALLTGSPHMLAAQALLGLRVGREFSSDTMGDGPQKHFSCKGQAPKDQK